MTVAIRFYNGFLTLKEPISNLFITSNHEATEKQRLYQSTRVDLEITKCERQSYYFRHVTDLCATNIAHTYALIVQDTNDFLPYDIFSTFFHIIIQQQNIFPI